MRKPNSPPTFRSTPGPCLRDTRIRAGFSTNNPARKLRYESLGMNCQTMPNGNGWECTRGPI